MIEYYYEINNRKFIIQVGSNSQENWKLIDDSDSFDLWLHVNNNPSCHVIIKEKLSKDLDSKESDSKESDSNQLANFNYPIDVIKVASAYCKSHSKYKNTKCSIIYTIIENIKKGKSIGSVITKNEKYITI